MSNLKRRLTKLEQRFGDRSKLLSPAPEDVIECLQTLARINNGEKGIETPRITLAMFRQFVAIAETGEVPSH